MDHDLKELLSAFNAHKVKYLVGRPQDIVDIEKLREAVQERPAESRD